MKTIAGAFILIIFFCSSLQLSAQRAHNSFKVIGFYTAKNDLAHISFVHEANRWFNKMSSVFNFTYDSTNNWDLINLGFLKRYQVVIFLDTRPDSPYQREAFRQYMEQGGGWIGFHFSAFALTPSAYPQNWDWYHNEFLGSGEYLKNTWRPTVANIRIERNHPVTRHLHPVIVTAPNEWYCWKNDLRKNSDIEILASIDPSSFPLGTGPKQNEIWHSGYYPVVWTNKKYRMVYLNMGHNDMDYEHGTNRQLSSTFDSEEVNKMLVNILFWLGRPKDTIGGQSLR